MVTKEKIKQFVDSELESCDYASNFSELDSLSKLEVIMKCEGEYMIGIDENDVEHDWDTDMLVDYIVEKANKERI